MRTILYRINTISAKTSNFRTQTNKSTVLIVIYVAANRQYVRNISQGVDTADLTRSVRHRIPVDFLRSFWISRRAQEPFPVSTKYLTFLMKSVIPVMDVWLIKKIGRMMAAVISSSSSSSRVYDKVTYAHMLNDFHDPEMSQFRVSTMEKK